MFLFIELRLCVRTIKETEKCEWLKTVVAEQNYPSSITARNINKVSCVSALDNYDCLVKIESNEVDVVNLDAGTAYYASLNFVSTLLVSETYANNGEGFILNLQHFTH